MNTIKYTSLVEVTQALNKGTVIYWSSLLYRLKIDFDGDLVIRSTDGKSGQLMTMDHLSELFTRTNSISTIINSK